ncbi:MAG TPA: maleylpyruvate isomerase family mycothiol-dependent enzyme [Actinoplanes sp.]|nr:maleylpyruvate isomerase family mycothiol-dependent enzyme [Actinoplanes sp.]
MEHLTTDELVSRTTAAHQRELKVIGELQQVEIGAPSALPGWSRGHVIAARIVFTRAVLRQIEYATSGREIEFFDGGRAGRDAEIEYLAHRPAALVATLHEELDALQRVWAGLDAGQWGLSVTYRGDSGILDLAWASWRECELHLVDLDVGAQPSAWPEEFCLGLFRFLAPRVPDGLRLVLTAHDGRSWEVGVGEPVTIQGNLTDLAAWLAGRPTQGPVASPAGTLPILQRLRAAGRRQTSA